MTALLVISALLLIASGGIKLRVGARTGLGVPPLSLVELLAGVGIAASALTGDPTVESGFRLVLGGVALVLGVVGAHGHEVCRQAAGEG